MALLFADDFDHYTTVSQRYTLVTDSSSVGIEAGQGRYGTSALYLQFPFSTSGPTVQRAFPACQTVIVGAAFKAETAWGVGAVPCPILCLMANASSQIQVNTNSAGNLEIYQGANSVLLGTAAPGLLPGIWYFIEVKASIDAAAGSVEVRLNGNTVFTYNGNTQPVAGSAWVNNLQTQRRGTISLSGKKIWMDDLRIADSTGTLNNDFDGDPRVKNLVPDAIGNYDQWTPVGAATSLDCVDDAAPNDDTNYISTGTAAHKVSLSQTAVGVDASSEVRAVIVRARMRKDDAGSRSARAFARIGGVDYFHATTNSLGDAYAYYDAIFETSPATGLAWTPAEIDAAEFGWELVS